MSIIFFSLHYLTGYTQIDSNNTSESNFRQVENQINVVKTLFAESNIDTNAFVYIPVFYPTEKNKLKAVNTISEVLIVNKKNLKVIGAYALCTHGGGDFQFKKKNFYKFSTMPCRYDDRNESFYFNYFLSKHHSKFRIACRKFFFRKKANTSSSK